jgi:hypothetical protein
MHLNKLFRLLVMGGAVLAGAPSCGPQEGPETTGGGPALTGSPGTTDATDAGVPNGGSGGGNVGSGGGVNFW